MLLVACAPDVSRLEAITVFPMKDVAPPAIKTGLLRAQYNFVMRGAVSVDDQKKRLGEYFFCEWYNATPDMQTKLVIEYQQSSTGSQIIKQEYIYKPGQLGKGIQEAEFHRLGEEYKKGGVMLTWRLSIYVNGKCVDSRHSFMWRDPK